MSVIPMNRKTINISQDGTLVVETYDTRLGPVSHIHNQGVLAATFTGMVVRERAIVEAKQIAHSQGLPLNAFL